MGRLEGSVGVLVSRDLPCLIYEDAHLLVVNKPAGINTHAPAPHASEGIYDWLRHREPDWANLAIVHRLDKPTSGVLIFGKTPLANRSLTEQFTRRAVRKRYLFLTDRAVPAHPIRVVSSLQRIGEKYVTRAAHPNRPAAETEFQAVKASQGRTLVEARPLTGRTHQIRAHAAHQGFPILGDVLYGGTPAARVCLHSAEMVLRHPATGELMDFQAPADFTRDFRLEMRSAFIEPDLTDSCRWIHGAADNEPGWYVDKLDGFLLSQSAESPTARQKECLARWIGEFNLKGAYHKRLLRDVRLAGPQESSPQPLLGQPAPEEFEIRENGVRYAIRFGEGYSIGLFLDQRDNRRRLLKRHIAAGFDLDLPPRAEALNLFAYTCGFSVCAALGGMQVTSLDLSEKYLEWGRKNFLLNNIDPAGHVFLHGDAFDWLRRLKKKERRFALLLLDPPTFSQSKKSGRFQAEKDYGRLVSEALPLLEPGGILFASTNAARLAPQKFMDEIEQALSAARRSIRQKYYFPQPPDFPIHPDEPDHLKTIWYRIQ